MKLKTLIKNIPIKQIKGTKEIEITGICINSKLIAPGNIFVAKKGRTNDGAKYIPEAISAGAVAVLTDILDPSLKEITQLVHPNVSEIEALLVANFYQFASDQLFTVGITGTNGKTTTSFLAKYLLDHIYGPCGLIGTIEYIIGQQRYQATRTTPDIAANHKMLREMVLQGCRSAVMEVTSHALDQERTKYIEYDVAVFTNLSVDHLDYHHSMEEYCQTKAKLFTNLKAQRKPGPKYAIVNVDNPWHARMIENCPAKIITYGIDNVADLRASNIEMSNTESHFVLSYKGKEYSCTSPLVGRYNIYNVLAATAIVLTKGCELEILIPLIKLFTPVPGRLEQVPNALGRKIYVDFAHSDDALTNVLECLQEIKKEGKIITVFGCGGDRDKTKRPRMAKACEALSDLCIVTTDNPRSEDPQTIIQEIVKGFAHPNTYIVEVDRHAAIALAIGMMGPADILLIAGKGHEPYQIFAHKIVEFDDRKVAAKICQQIASRTTKCTT